jgi:hypothetical protein
LKLLRFGSPGAEKPGLLDPEGRIRDLSGVIGDIDARAVTPTALAGYFVCNDVSERAFQLERGGQWDEGKGCDGFEPIGP